MTSKTLETLILDTGGCGRFQILQLLAINSLHLLAFWGIMFMAFGNYNPGWTCKQANVTSLETTFTPGNTTSSISSNFSSNWNIVYPNRSKCLVQDTEPSVFSHGNATRASVSSVGQDNCPCFASCRAVEFNNHAKTIVSEWGLVCGNKWIVSLIISLQMVGFFVGCATAGQISERFGRRAALYGNSALYSAASFAAVFSVSWPMYTAFLFLIGIGAGGVMTVAMVYSFEFLQPRWRGILGGLPLLNFTTTVFSLVVFLERDWQLVHITMAVVTGVCLIPFFWAPESMRWLAVQGRIEEAEAVVAKMAATNGHPVPDRDSMEVLYKMADDQHTATSRKYTYLDLFKEKSLRGLTIKLSICWTFLITVYFTLSFSVKVFHGDFYVNLFIYSIVEIPFAIFVGPLVNRWGRRLIGTGIFFFSFLACVALVIIKLTESEKDSHATAIFVITAAVKSAMSGGKCVISIVTAELPPTMVRSLFYALCMLISRIGIVIAPYLVPEGDTFHVSLSIMAALLLPTAAIFLSLPETKDQSMEDTVHAQMPMPETGVERNGGKTAMLETGVK